MVLNAKFWSLLVHTYQKQFFLMVILAVRGHRKILVIDRNFMGKKWKFENFDQNSSYIPQRKAKNIWNSDSGRKSMICFKKMEKYHLKAGEKFFPFFRISKFFFEKWLQWDVARIERNKLMKFELILSIHKSQEIIYQGVRWPPPPCRRGLTRLNMLFQP